MTFPMMAIVCSVLYDPNDSSARLLSAALRPALRLAVFVAPHQRALRDTVVARALYAHMAVLAGRKTAVALVPGEAVHPPPALAPPRPGVAPVRGALLCGFLVRLLWRRGVQGTLLFRMIALQTQDATATLGSLALSDECDGLV